MSQEKRQADLSHSDGEDASGSTPPEDAAVSARLLFADVTVLSPLEELSLVHENRTKGLRGIGSGEREAQLTRAHAMARDALQQTLTGDETSPTEPADVERSGEVED